MSGSNEPIRSAIEDARALLDTLLSSDVQDVHIVSGEIEIFIARDGGRPNPMRQAPAIATSPPVAPAADEQHLVTAPHIATIVEVTPVGTQVKSGACLATIRVLDTEETVPAAHAGTVIAVHVEAGALVEFKAPILTLRMSGR